MHVHRSIVIVLHFVSGTTLQIARVAVDAVMMTDHPLIHHPFIPKSLELIVNLLALADIATKLWADCAKKITSEEALEIEDLVGVENYQKMERFFFVQEASWFKRIKNAAFRFWQPCGELLTNLFYFGLEMYGYSSPDLKIAKHIISALAGLISLVEYLGRTWINKPSVAQIFEEVRANLSQNTSSLIKSTSINISEN